VACQSIFVILGNQLFPHRYLPPLSNTLVFMAEDRSLASHYRYHKHKIILFLSAMRAYAAQLQHRGVRVDYHKLSDADAENTYERKLAAAVAQSGATELITFEIEDKFFEARMTDFCREHQLTQRVLQSPMFLTSRPQFQQYLQQTKTPLLLANFYAAQRRRLGIMMDARGKPAGGQFSFDADNRKPLPKTMDPPPPTIPKTLPGVATVAALVDQLFPDHPGDASNFWLPVTRRGALAWMNQFLEQRFAHFGPYEDAIPPRSDFVYHSVLSPLLNLGLLTPVEVIDAALAHAASANVPLASVEGFIRQIIGWREFVRGIYQNFSQQQERGNFFHHQGRLSDIWYRGNTGIPPLDDAISKVLRYGWCHHIQRLMVVLNLMQLVGIHPHEVHRWFMEMFVDSSDWVMGPNVFGMYYSDGGLMMTKPYLCGSNYLRKMSGHPKGDWCDTVDGLFWSFINRHRDALQRNPRTMYMPTLLDKIAEPRKQQLFAAATNFCRHAVITPLVP
jgi:deoxyribodipyrimidine photolyase-related protein